MIRWIIIAGVASVGCGSQEAPVASTSATITVAWTGKHAGSLAAPATASWCAADSMLQVVAIQGDTGIGLALFVQDTIRVTQHPVVPPEVVVPWRPLGSAALRWIGDTDLVGYEAIAGVISVTAVDSGVSGTLDLGLRVPGGTDTLHLTGEFVSVPIEPSRATCGRYTKVAAQLGAS